MPIAVDWDAPDRYVLRYTVTGQWTWAEFYEALAQGREKMNEAPQLKVHSIVHFVGEHQVPRMAISHFRRLSQPQTRHLKTGITVLVGANRFIHALLAILKKLLSDRLEQLQIADDLEVARAKIELYDKKQPTND